MEKRVAVVIPCYRVKKHILGVIESIDSDVSRIYVVDDKCPEASGDFVETNCVDPRVVVLKNIVNLGVGGATLRGLAQAFQDGACICVKVDGDGQMDPANIWRLVLPIQNGDADYTKGNRFFDISNIGVMPPIRIFGNSCLSFLSKISSGYWDIFDPTNGFLAIHRIAYENINADKIDMRFFFESDMLFRLNLARCVVIDVPLEARYGDETSNLKISSIVFPFFGAHLRNFVKRIFYSYFLRDFTVGTVYLTLGMALLIFGAVFGLTRWISLSQQDVEASAGTVMLAALPVVLGFQMLMSFITADISSVPKYPLQRRLGNQLTGKPDRARFDPQMSRPSPN